MYRIYERFAHFKNKPPVFSPFHPDTSMWFQSDTWHATQHLYIITVPWLCMGIFFFFFFQETNFKKWFMALMSRATAAATDVSLFKRRCVWSASHSFISVHVGKTWWTTAIAAIVLCYSQSPVITVRFCTFIQFWYLTEFFGEMSCVLHM